MHRPTHQLVALAAARPKQAAAVNYNIRFYPLCLEARERVRGGQIGEVYHAHGCIIVVDHRIDPDRAEAGVAPRRTVPTIPPDLFITVQEIPETACIGDLVEFSLLTTPGNECSASVDYMGNATEWTGMDLERLTAGSDGLCSWVWMIDEKIVPGKARLYASVGNEVTRHVMMPHSFDVEFCGQ